MNSNDFNNNQKNNLLNSNEIQNNDLIKSEEFMFNFNNSKFLWKELMKLNTKYIERSADVSSISPYVQNILCSRLSLDNIDMLSEEYIIQLVTLLQLTGQYLVYTQKMLEEENDQLKEEINYLKNNITDNEKYMKTIDDLNRQNQEKDFLIKTYQDMIQTRNGIGDINENNTNIKSNPELFDTKKTYYYCSICSGKKFKSQKYLDEHMERRHFNQKGLIRDYRDEEEKKIQEKNYKQEFEDKLNLMRKEIEGMIKQKEDNNEFAMLNKKLELLQNQMLQQNYNNILTYRNNFNYQNKANNQQNIIKKEVKEKNEKSLNKNYKKKYEDLEKEYKDLYKKNEEKDQMLKDLQKQMNSIEPNKGGGILMNPIYDDLKNSKIIQKERNKTKYNTGEIINYKINNQTANININDVNKEKYVNNRDNKSYKEDEKRSQETQNKEPLNNQSGQENDKNEGKIFVNIENYVTPTGDKSGIFKEKDKTNDKKLTDTNANNNIINIKNSEVFDNKNILNSNIFNQENNDKLKTEKNIINQIPQNQFQFIGNSININNEKNEIYPLTVSKFCKEFEERNDNYKGEEDYNKINIPEKYHINVEQKIEDKKEEIKEKLNNSISSNNVKKLMKDNEKRDDLYKKYYEKLNEALNIKGVLDSYNRYQQEKNKFQMIARPSGENTSIHNSGNNNPGGPFILKTSTNDFIPNKTSLNPYSGRTSKVKNSGMNEESK